MNADAPRGPRLTSLSHGGGCGCKIAPGVLSEILRNTGKMPMPPQLLVGIETADDAAVYQLTDEIALGRDHRFLHADRRRPVRLRSHRGRQCAQRCLCDGRPADHGAGARRHADQRALDRGHRQDSRRRRIGLSRRRHSDRGRPHDRLGRADLRARRDGRGASRAREAQRRCAGRRSPRAGQADRRGRAVRCAQEGEPVVRGLCTDDRDHDPAERAGPRPRGDGRRACLDGRDRLRPRRPRARDGARREGGRRDRLGARAAARRRARAGRARHGHRRLGTQLGRLRRRGGAARGLPGGRPGAADRSADEWRPARVLRRHGGGRRAGAVPPARLRCGRGEGSAKSSRIRAAARG